MISILGWTLLIGGCLAVPISMPQGTSPFLEQIFLGRCYDFQNVLRPDLFKDNPKNCTYLWELFTAGFAYESPCDVYSSDYTAFVEEAAHPLPKDKSMLWTGVGGFVYDYTSGGKRFTGVADTLTGYLVNNLIWCGQESDPGIDYSSCPSWGGCSNESQISFWKEVSKVFSRMSHGKVYVMLNGSYEIVVRPTSILALYELPNLQKDKVSTLHALLVNRIGLPVMSTCQNESVLDLAVKVNDLGIPFNCTDDPADIMYLLCVDQTDTQECRLISEELGYISATNLLLPSVVNILSGILAFVAITLYCGKS